MVLLPQGNFTLEKFTYRASRTLVIRIGPGRARKEPVHKRTVGSPLVERCRALARITPPLKWTSPRLRACAAPLRIGQDVFNSGDVDQPERNSATDYPATEAVPGANPLTANLVPSTRQCRFAVKKLVQGTSTREHTQFLTARQASPAWGTCARRRPHNDVPARVNSIRQ